MEFIHCNFCGSHPFGGPRNYCLSSCGHVFCDNCIRKVVDVCIICKTKCRLLEINAQTKPDIKYYFMDGSDVLKDSAKRIVQMLQFQKNHVKSLSAHYKNKIGAYDTLYNEFEESKIKIADLMRDNSNLRRENDDLKRKIEACQQREQSWIGTGSVPNPLGIGEEFFRGNTVEPSSPFMTNKALTTFNATPMPSQMCQTNLARDATVRRSEEHFGPIGSGRQRTNTPVSRPSYTTQQPSRVSSTGGMMGTDYGQQRERITLPYNPHTPTPINIGSQGFRSNTSGPRFMNTPDSAGRNDMLERLRKLRCDGASPKSVASQRT